jgi:hypothetical protein
MFGLLFFFGAVLPLSLSSSGFLRICLISYSQHLRRDPVDIQIGLGHCRQGWLFPEIGCRQDLHVLAVDDREAGPGAADDGPSESRAGHRGYKWGGEYDG